MKKKALSKKSTKHISSKTQISQPKQTLLYTRVVIISACLLLFCVGELAINNRHAMIREVAGVSIIKGMFSQATVYLPPVPNAASYNIYYTQDGTQGFAYAVRHIPANVRSYTISYLKNDVKYQYQYSAANKKGKEFLFSAIKPLTNTHPM